MRPSLRLLALLPLLAGACVTDTTFNKDTGDPQIRLGLTDEQVRRILDFLNACSTTFDLLDKDVDLDSDSAENLVGHRDGPDQACGTADDDSFESLDEVLEVPQVGDRTVLAILDYLVNGPPVDTAPDNCWEGVCFSDDEQRISLEIANGASEAELDDAVKLDADTSANIVGARPIGSMDALAAVPDVGQSALEKIKAYVPTWAAAHGG